MTNHEDLDDPFFDDAEDVEHGDEPELTDGEAEQVEQDLTGDETEQANEPEQDGDIADTGETEPEQAEGTESEKTPEQVAEEAAKAEALAKSKLEAEAGEKAVAEFKALVDATIVHEDRDKDTGQLPVVLIQAVVDEYNKIPGSKYKAQVKSWMNDLMQDLMVASKFIEARAVMILNQGVKAAKGNKPDTVARPKVDPTVAFVERVTGFMLAASLLTVPDGIEADWAERATKLAGELGQEVLTYKAWLEDKADPKPEAPKVHAAVLTAAKLAQGRVVGAPRKASTDKDGKTSTPRPTSSGDGIKRDIGKHIREAMDSVAVGEFLSVSQLVKFESQEYAGTAPSSGAISARLFPGGDAAKCNLDFVRPEGRDEGHDSKGAVRTK